MLSETSSKPHRNLLGTFLRPFPCQVGRSAGDECAAALREVTAIVDTELMRNKTAVKELFGAEKVGGSRGNAHI